jgi:hypothetical protein
LYRLFIPDPHEKGKIPILKFSAKSFRSRTRQAIGLLVGSRKRKLRGELHVTRPAAIFNNKEEEC